MTSTIKVNTIQNTCGADIIKESGNTITIGASGDTVTLASGASQSGFGRSGSVNWQTGSLKTSTFTAVSGEGYFINSGSAITMNLPAGVAGAIVAVSDYARNFATYNLTISPNGSEKIGGTAADAILNVNGQAATFVYVDSTKGWVNVQNAEDTEVGLTFITATGGTVSCSGNYKIHTFTGPGTFCVSSISGVAANNVVDYLVVAGGGGSQCGGGGAGGFRSSNSTCMPSPQTSPLANPTGITVTASAFPITVGSGGAHSSADNTTTNGSSSSFSTITSAGGGRTRPSPGPSPGGSGGGAYNSSVNSGQGGNGNDPATSPPQGQDGGDCPSPSAASGGGGGAGGVGGDAPGPRVGGTGSYMISSGFAGCHGTTGPVSGARYFSGGGGGGASSPNGFSSTTAASGGGGQGIANSSATARPGPQCGGTNTGGGAGGAWFGVSGSGGSGIVIIRYKYQ